MSRIRTAPRNDYTPTHRHCVHMRRSLNNRLPKPRREVGSDRRLLLKNVIASLNLKASHATATVMDVPETRTHIEIELANGTTHTSRIRMPACRKTQG